MAVAGQSGIVTLAYDAQDQFTTNAVICHKPHKNTATITIPCTSLDEIFRNNHIEICDFLKMDCVGTEFDILYKCPQKILTRIKKIAMEVHGKPQEIVTPEEYLMKKRLFNQTSTSWHVVGLHTNAASR